MVMDAVEKLRALGFVKLATKISERFVKIFITESETGVLWVTTPYSEESVNALRGVPGRRWDPMTKQNSFPKSSRFALWEALKACFPGQYGQGRTGLDRKSVGRERVSSPV